MDALTRAAVTGTSRETPPASGLPTDDLFEGAMSLEKNLLLRAGARAIYRTAGRRAETGVEPPRPAPEETLPACSAKAAEVVRSLFDGKRDGVLLEALERIQLAGRRLPHALLPAALNVERKELRPAVLAVLGERGRWLAGMNPEWGWATASESDEAAWQEGALEERISALRRARSRDAGQGRLLIEDVWKTEKVEARAEMVRALEESLSSGDEPFLERALDDRSVRVREAAADLLVRLPGSAYAERAAARADTVLSGYDPPARGLLGRRRNGKLVVSPPETVQDSWKRDMPGEEKPPHGVGEKAWMVSRILAKVPPGHWEERFGAGPSELVAAARGDWEAALLTGWCSATATHRAGAWALPLWERCYESFGESPEYEIVFGATYPMVHLLPQTDLAAALRRLLRDGEMTVRMAQTLDVLPGPWARDLGLWYLEALRERARKVFSNPRDTMDHWPGTLGTAAEKLPPSCFQHAPGPPPEKVQHGQEGEGFQTIRREPYQAGYWRRELEKFEETLELRRKLVEEIPL